MWGGVVGMRVVNSVQVFSMSFIRPIHISSATSSAFTFVILVIPTFTSIPRLHPLLVPYGRRVSSHVPLPYTH